MNFKNTNKSNQLLYSHSSPCQSHALEGENKRIRFLISLAKAFTWPLLAMRIMVVNLGILATVTMVLFLMVSLIFPMVLVVAMVLIFLGAWELRVQGSLP